MHLARTHKALLSLVLALLAPALARADDAETRTSEAPIDLDAAWAETGFRMQLRLGYERLAGQLPAPASPAFAIGIEPSYRLRQHLSLGLGLRYAVLLGNWAGLRWNTTADVGWHPLAGSFVVAGVGLGGIIGDRVAYDVVHHDDGSFVTTEGRSASRLRRCSGQGAVALTRAGYLIIVGELLSTGPVMQVDVQRTRCQGEDLAGEPRTEVWWHPSVQLSWAFTWR